jgi:hypothetical protein
MEPSTVRHPSSSTLLLPASGFFDNGASPVWTVSKAASICDIVTRVVMLAASIGAVEELTEESITFAHQLVDPKGKTGSFWQFSRTSHIVHFVKLIFQSRDAHDHRSQ